MSLLSLLFLGPLFWRLWRDRLESRALELQAEIQAAINASLGGESMIAVRVNAGSREQSGTVELFVPAGWEDMPSGNLPAGPGDGRRRCFPPVAARRLL